jgi:hypothetical protein
MRDRVFQRYPGRLCTADHAWHAHRVHRIGDFVVRDARAAAQTSQRGPLVSQTVREMY